MEGVLARQVASASPSRVDCRLAWSGSTLWASDHQQDSNLANVLWSIAPSGEVHQFRGVGEDLAISPAAPGALFEARGTAVVRYDISTGTPGPAEGLDVPAEGSQLTLSPDGRLLYVAGRSFCVVRVSDGRVVACRTQDAGAGVAVAASATAVVLGQSATAGNWTAAVTGPHLEGPVLFVGGAAFPARTVAHGVAIGDGLALVAVRVGTNGGSYELTSYRLP